MSNFWGADHGEQLRGVEACFRPEIIISRTSRNNNDLPCYKSPFRWHVGGYLAMVARTVSTMPGQAFGRIGGKGPAGPTRAAVLRSRRTASVRRTLDRAECPDQKEEFAVQQSRRTSPPFPDVSPKACGGNAQGTWRQARRLAVAGTKVRSNKAEGLRWQGIRYVTTSPNKSRYCSRSTFRA